MPCMGPSVNEDEVNRAYEEIMALLKDKYKLQGQPHPIWCGFMNDNLNRVREKANVQLKEAIHNMFLTQACEDF